jgi:signal peptidase complex subunit 2
MAKSDKTTNSEEEEVVLLQVDTGDIIKLKQILDETVANTFLEENMLEGHDPNAKNVGLKEDHKLNNIKLILMTVACIFAMIAQFSPLPFPESRPVLGCCCALYFMLSGVLQLITTFLDKDCILITKVVDEGLTAKENLKKNPNLTKYGLRVRTIFPKFSEFYAVRIEYQGMETSPFAKQTWSVGQFFDKEGMFDEYGLMYEVEALYRRFEKGKFDTEDDKIKKE